MQKTVEGKGQLKQLHPYEYLTELNSIYSSCNKLNAKTFSSVSKVKLAWKPFSIMKIPNYFQDTYDHTQSNLNQNKPDELLDLESSDKKIWKQHYEILKRYSNKSQQIFRSRPKTCTGKRAILQNQATSSPQSSLLLKRLMQKGIKVEYSKEQVKQKVIQKLKQLSRKKKSCKKALDKKFCRVQSTLSQNLKMEDKILVREEQQQNRCHMTQFYKPKQERQNIESKQYLLYEKNADIVAAYRQKIRQTDCAISDNNVRKTTELLKNMQSYIEKLT